MSRQALASIVLGVLLLGASPTARALDPDAGAQPDAPAEFAPLPAPLQSVRDEDRGALEVLALYQEPLRAVLLEVTRHPQTLVALERAQADTRERFRALLEPLPEAQRDQVWDLVRAPALIAALADASPPTPDEIEALSREHPEEIRAAALAVSREDPDLLREIARLQADFEAEFDALVRGLDEGVEAAFRSALAHPELLEILSAHMHLSVLLGEAYERDPQGLESALASLANEVAARTASAREDWIRALDEDPEARAELEQATAAYAEEEGLDYAEQTLSPEETQVAFLVYPYPYWFGFPGFYYGFYYGFYPYAAYWWYPYYPHHHPHHFGFYYGSRHRTVVYGFPSYCFLRWYYGSESHHERYPRLSRHFTRHRGSHRYSHDRVSHYVERWQRSNHPREERWRNSGPRVARLRDSARPARGMGERARKRPESRHGWGWLVEDRGRVGPASGRVREAERSPRAVGHKASSVEARRPRSEARERPTQQQPRRRVESGARRAPRSNERHAIGGREKRQRKISAPSAGRAPRALGPRKEAPSRQRAARGLQRQDAGKRDRSRPAERGRPRPGARGPGSRDH